MSIEIIRKRTRTEEDVYELAWYHDPATKLAGGGYTFECDSKGNVFEDRLHPCALDNLKELRAKRPHDDIIYWTRKITLPAIGKCKCGHHVGLSNDENDCPRCGRIYNCFGQELKRRDDPTRYDDMDISMEIEAEAYERMERGMY